MIRSLFVLNATGEVIIEKHCRGVNLQRTACDAFWREVARCGYVPEDVPPVMRATLAADTGATVAQQQTSVLSASSSSVLCHVQSDGLYFLADVDVSPAQHFSPPALVLDFLHCVVATLRDYGGGGGGDLSDDAIRENFVTVYELLEEMLDNGFPSTTELNALRQIVEPPTVLSRVVEAVTGSRGAAPGSGGGGGGGGGVNAGADSVHSGGGGGGGTAASTTASGGIMNGLGSSSSAVGALASSSSSALSAAAESVFATINMAASGWSSVSSTSSSSAPVFGQPMPSVSSASSSSSSSSVSSAAPAASRAVCSADNNPISLPNMPWRSPHVRYTTNEVFVDVVEELDAILRSDTGAPLACTIRGAILCNSRLSGVPDLVLRLRNAERVVDDAWLHPCVRLGRFERDGVMSFVPPDGQFKLASYVCRSEDATRVFPVAVSAQFFRERPRLNSMRVQVTLAPRFTGGRQVENLEVEVALCGGSGGGGDLQRHDVASCNVKASAGAAMYDPAACVIRWRVPKMTTAMRPTLSGVVKATEPHGRLARTPHVKLSFAIPQFAMSGLTVDSLTVLRETYRPYKGLRCVTRTARVEVRP